MKSTPTHLALEKTAAFEADGPAWDIMQEYPGLSSNEFLHDLGVADALRRHRVGLPVDQFMTARPRLGPEEEILDGHARLGLLHGVTSGFADLDRA